MATVSISCGICAAGRRFLVIVLSARVGERDKIAGLDAGADDYLTKPFAVGELLARVRAATRRSGSKEDLPSIFEFGDVSLNMSLRTVQKGGVEIHLTPTEYRLLCLLAANEGKVLTHHQLLTDVWGPNRSKDGHYLRVYMGHLRQKLENEPAHPRHDSDRTRRRISLGAKAAPIVAHPRLRWPNHGARSLDGDVRRFPETFLIANMAAGICDLNTSRPIFATKAIL